MKNVTNYTMHVIQKLHTFHNHLKSHYNSLQFHQYFYYTFHLTYLLAFFYISNFHSLYILLCHMFYHI